MAWIIIDDIDRSPSLAIGFRARAFLAPLEDSAMLPFKVLMLRMRPLIPALGTACLILATGARGQGIQTPSSRAPLIAVTSFDAPSLDPDAQASIVSALSSALLEQGKVRVMEREQMDRILAEQGFSASGACDTNSCALEMGRILAVDQLISGRIGRVGQTYTISARRVDVRTGEVLRSITRNTRGEIDDVLTLLVPDVAEDLVKDPGRSSETVATSVAADSARAAAASPEGIQPSEEGRPLWPWIAGGAVLVGGGVAGALLFLGSDGTSAPAASGETGTAGDLTVRWAE